MSDLIVGGPVERCLDELFDNLAGTGAAGRRALAEAEDHLRAAVDDGVARGIDPAAAEQEAAARFGQPAAIAAELAITHRGGGALIRPLLSATVWIGIVAALALGVSGLVTEVLGRTAGATFVAGDQVGVTYTTARCADFFEYFPHASSCNAAAALHHWGEVAQGREMLGILGLLALGGWAVMRRRTPVGGPAWRPPAPTVALVIAGLAGVAGVLLVGVSLMSVAFGQTAGVGANLSDGSVAIVVALGAVAWFARRTRHHSGA
jgi:hypothetical protein